MHPFIQGFLEPTKENANGIKFLSQDDPLEKMLAYIFNNINNSNKPTQEVLEEFDTIFAAGHKDEDMFLYFAIISVLYFSQHLHLEKAASLKLIAENLIHKNTHPILKSFFYQCASRLSLRQSNIEEEIQLSQKAIDLIDPGHPRYRPAVFNFAGTLSRIGMLEMLGAKEREILYGLKLKHTIFFKSYFEILLTNSAIAGDFERIEALLVETKENDEKLWLSGKANAELLISILKNDDVWRRSKDNEFAETKEVYANFLENKPNLNLSFLEIKRVFQSSTSIGMLLQFLPIVYELNQGNFGKAKYLLANSSEFIHTHFLFDFYYARIALHEGDLFLARKLMDTLTKNIAKYKYQNRLAFELEISKNFSAIDFYKLVGEPTASLERPVKTSVEVEQTSDKPIDLIIGQSASIVEIKVMIQKLAKTGEQILITGETGTGKELVARAIHDEGENASEPFLAINCGALTDTLLQSELFGYEKGAFTGAAKSKEGIFASAGKGTVFLDEFGDISPKLQNTLLRVLESKEIRKIGSEKSQKVACKILLATNVDFKKAIENKTFREDLYYRVNRLNIKIPPLRERKEDIPLLMNFYINRNNGNQQVSKDLEAELLRYDWPGNIRQLKNSIEKMTIIHAEKQIFELEDFDFNQLEGFQAKVTSETKKNAKPASYVEEPYALDEEYLDKIIHKPSKSQRRQSLLKEVFKKYKKLSRQQAVEILSVSPITAASDLKSLEKQGYVKMVKPSKSSKSHYFEIVEV